MQNAKLSVQKLGLDSSTKILQKIYLGGFCLLALVLFYCQIIKGNYYLQRAKNNYVKVIPLRAVRGSIFDCNGTRLAYDKAIFNISVIPYQIKNKKDALFEKLSDFLNYDLRLIHKNYDKNLKSLFCPADILIDIGKTISLQLKEKFKDTIAINPQPQRHYPYPYQFAHLLGYVKEASAFYEKLKKYGYSPLERAGFLGIEQYYDTYLKGKDGGSLIEVDVKGKMVGFLGQQATKKGKDIYLTVDSRVQEVAAKSLGNNKGTIMLMNSQNGKIISLYSYPSFNPNYFVKGKNINKFLTGKNSPLINRAIQATYPAGSTFKPLLGVAALEEKSITPFTTFICNGKLKIGNTSFNCWSTHKRQNLYEAIAHSCNVYFYNVGRILGPDLISKWAKRFGLDSSTGIDLPYEKKGFVPTKKWKQKVLKDKWFTGDTLNFSIGQGFMETTPLAITTALNIFASNGYLITPYILKQVDDVSSGLTAKTHSGITDENIKTIKNGLRRVVTDEKGTAHILKELNLRIFGKTGTAQTRGKSHGWFIGFFPYKKPKYTICVFMENGGSSHEAVMVTYTFLNEIKQRGFL